MPTFTFTPGFNAALIFGDFWSVFLFVTNIMSGGTLGIGPFQQMTGILGAQPGGIGGPIDTAVLLLLGIMFDSATVFLALYIISFRSL